MLPVAEVWGTLAKGYGWRSLGNNLFLSQNFSPSPCKYPWLSLKVHLWHLHEGTSRQNGTPTCRRVPTLPHCTHTSYCSQIHLPGFVLHDSPPCLHFPFSSHSMTHIDKQPTRKLFCKYLLESTEKVSDCGGNDGQNFKGAVDLELFFF